MKPKLWRVYKMNKFKSKLRAFFVVSYRLAIWTQRGNLYNIRGDNAKELMQNAKFYKPTHWALYKKGRFGLPEREIRRSE